MRRGSLCCDSQGAAFSAPPALANTWRADNRSIPDRTFPINVVFVISGPSVRPSSQKCRPYPFYDNDREQIGARLQIHIMYNFYQGLYYCTVSYQKTGRSLKFTRRLEISPVCELAAFLLALLPPTGYSQYNAASCLTVPTFTSKEPTILVLTHNQDFPIKRGRCHSRRQTITNVTSRCSWSDVSITPRTGRDVLGVMDTSD